MKEATNYLSHNLNHWNKSTDAHWDSDFYNVKGWLDGSFQSLREIELALLPKDLSGLKVLHLQCHFGQDTLSMARMGAEVTGVDLSDRAIAKANELAKLAQLEGRFINCDVYSLPEHLDEAATFDIVFTSYGTIGWLPDLDKWARIVQHYLKPGGAFIFAEFHPVIWTLNHERNGFEYSYFNRQAIVESYESTYASKQKEQTTEVGWNHPHDEVIMALLNQGLSLEAFHEFDFSPWNCFHDTVEVGPYRYQFKGLEGKLPITYSLKARKKEA